MRRLLLLLTLLFVTKFHYSQDCIPDSPITLSRPELNKSSLVNLINQTKPRFKEEDLNRVMRQIGKCNQQLEIDLQSIENEISNYSLKVQELHRFKDVPSIQKRISDLRAGLKASKEELQKNLKQTSQTGVFAVLLKDIDIYADKNQFIRQAQDGLSPFAIENLNGVNIKRMTEIVNFKPVSDVIESFVSGEMVVKKRFLDQANYEEAHFLYAVQVSVSPLEKKQLQGKKASLAKDVLIVQLDEGRTFESKLISQGVSSEDIESIHNSALPYVQLSQEENKNAFQRQQSILSKGKSEIQKIEQDITQAQKDLAERERKIQEFCKENGITYHKHDLDGSAKRALGYFRTKINELDSKWYQLKANEILDKNTHITIQGTPSESFAEEGLRLQKSLNKESGTISKTTEKVRIEDFEVTDYEAQKEVEIYREVERIWLYPIPQKGGSFKLTVFAKFLITGHEEIVENERKKEGSSEEVNPSSRLPYEPEMVLVEGGRFQMGCTVEQGDDCLSREKPAHWVSLDDFHIGKYEVTQAQWKAVMSNNPSYFKEDCDNCPVESVSWEDVQKFIQKLNELTGKQYRLPTEAEWEYAARGGEANKYAGSNDLDEVAWHGGNSGIKTHPVGRKSSNGYGLNDMSGNVYEWCSDWYKGYEVTDHTGSRRVIRGGSWDANPRNCRVSYRHLDGPYYRNNSIGFRVAHR